MKVLLINGSPRESGNTFTALSEWKMHKRLTFNVLHMVPYYRMKQIQKQFKRKYDHANH
jgi:hypothetical protein